MTYGFRRFRKTRKRFFLKYRKSGKRCNVAEPKDEKLEEKLTKLMEIVCRQNQQAQEIATGVSYVQQKFLEVCERLTNLENEFDKNVIRNSISFEQTRQRDVRRKYVHKKVRITGIPSQICDSSEDVVTQIFTNLQITEFRSSVSRIQEFKDKGNNGRVLILSVDDARVSKVMINKSRQKRGIPVSDLFTSTTTGTVYINENLTRDVYQLYTEAKKISRSKGWKSVFTNDGVIFAKKSYSEKCIIIATAQDLCAIN